MANHRICRIYNSLRDTTAVHKLTCHDKERNRHHREGVCSGEKILRKDLSVKTI